MSSRLPSLFKTKAFRHRIEIVDPGKSQRTRKKPVYFAS
jgi:hypothetical protein